MSRRPKGSIPSGREVARRVTCLGKDAFNEYVKLREKYRGLGLSAREAIERACTELQIMDRHRDWRARATVAEMLGKQVPLTPVEVKEVIPTYQAPGMTKAEEVGEEEMTLAEEVAWAWKQAARVQNGEDAPTKFPNDGALGWFQSAIGNRREFEKLVVRVRGPADGDNAYLQDGQHQFKEIAGQLKEAVRECGDRMGEIESGFGEVLKEATA